MKADLGESVQMPGPSHVGIIPDGIRRWARSNGVDLFSAYQLGLQRISQLLIVLQQEAVDTVSLYALSKKNLARTQTDIDPVFDSSEMFFNKYLPDALPELTCKVKAVGDLSVLPESYRRSLEALEQARNSGPMTIYILAAYDPMEELNSAVARMGGKAGDIAQRLWIPEDVDLVIRTSPEPMLSEFLPLQTRSAILRFLDIPLNELGKEDLLRILEQYRNLRRLNGL